MNTIKYILFDAANTLIHKPSLWMNFINVLNYYGYKVSESELKQKHKLLSEFITFPDVTSETFYKTFNKELLNALGIIDFPELLKSIFNTCKYLPWEVFEDVTYLNQYSQFNLGILSNFNTSLRTLVKEKIPTINFKHIIISEEEKIAKPSLEFYEKAVHKIGLKPQDILYVGDSLKLDIIPALQIGFNVRLIDRDQTYPSSKYSVKSLNNILK